MKILAAVGVELFPYVELIHGMLSRCEPVRGVETKYVLFEEAAALPSDDEWSTPTYVIVPIHVRQQETVAMWISYEKMATRFPRANFFYLVSGQGGLKRSERRSVEKTIQELRDYNPPTLISLDSVDWYLQIYTNIAGRCATTVVTNKLATILANRCLRTEADRFGPEYEIALRAKAGYLWPLLSEELKQAMADHYEIKTWPTGEVELLPFD